MKHIFLCLLVIFTFATTVEAQSDKPPFWSDIQAFKKTDSLQAPPQNAILLVGSSSLLMWRDVQTYFPDRTLINRGFGGSSLPDVIRYFDAVIAPYKAKQVVIYCGENDLAASDTVTAETVYKRFIQLYSMIRQQQPNVPVAFISIKPSPSRAHLMPKIVAANRLIQTFLHQQPNTVYVDVYNRMLTPEGKPMPELFLSDNLHMNAKGYAIWKAALEPVLVSTKGK